MKVFSGIIDSIKITNKSIIDTVRDSYALEQCLIEERKIINKLKEKQQMAYISNFDDFANDKWTEMKTTYVTNYTTDSATGERVAQYISIDGTGISENENPTPPSTYTFWRDMKTEQSKYAPQPKKKLRAKDLLSPEDYE